jgi:hypothetical protein
MPISFNTLVLEVLSISILASLLRLLPVMRLVFNLSCQVGFSSAMVPTPPAALKAVFILDMIVGRLSPVVKATLKMFCPPAPLLTVRSKLPPGALMLGLTFNP